MLYCNVNSPPPKKKQAGTRTPRSLLSDEIYVTGTQVAVSGVADLEYKKTTLDCGYAVGIDRDPLSLVWVGRFQPTLWPVCHS